MNIPDLLQPLVAGYEFEPVTIGDTCACVFRLLRENERGLFLKYAPSGSEIEDEAERLKWLHGRVLVPPVIAFVTEGEWEFLLTEALPGRDGTEVGRTHPEAVVTGLAQQLRAWHSQPIAECPFDESLAVQLEQARSRAHNGLVNEDDFDEERRGCSAIEVLAQLESECPQAEDRVLTHGDPCVPNIIFDGIACTGFIDCGRAGVGDAYRDLALAVRSIKRNLGQEWVRPFFDMYGLSKADEGKLAFYRLLDEFF